MRKLVLIAAAILIGGGSAYPAQADDRLPPSITVVGQAKISAKPDQADINVGVENFAATAQAALAANSTNMNALMNTIKQLNVPEKDVQTSGFNIEPQYPQNEESSNYKRPKIVGYRVSNEVHIRLHKLQELGAMLDLLVKSGANTINGISFSFAEPERLLDSVRGAAVADAHRKAELYATAAGIKVGRVLYINEEGGVPVPPRPMAFAGRMMGAMAAAPTPIAVGENEMSTSVSVVYAIGE